MPKANRPSGRNVARRCRVVSGDRRNRLIGYAQAAAALIAAAATLIEAIKH